MGYSVSPVTLSEYYYDRKGRITTDLQTVESTLIIHAV